MEEKQRRDQLEKNRDYDNMGHMGGYTDGLYDRNRNYDRDLIDAKRRQREHNTNEAIENLAKINANLSNKEKLIQLNENSRNPLNDGRPDYQYQRFQDQYAKRQKMINDNIDKYYPNMNNERPEIKSYYDKYVYNPNYDDKRNEGFNTINDYRDNVPKNINKKDYIKDLENQINYKNELKRREKEEDRRRGQQQYEDMQRELKKEEEEKYLKDKKQKEELIRANNELINQKNKMKMKELEDKLKYRELYDRQNEEYQKELERQKLEKERMKDDIYNHNKNEYEKRREREKELLDNKRYESDRYNNRGDNRYKYDNRYDNRDDYYKNEGRYNKGERYEDKYDNRRDNIYDGKGDKRYDDKYDYKDRNKYDDRYGNKDRDRDRYDNKDIGTHGKRKERVGRCCRCHRIFPRRLLTINRYFYKENRK